MVSAAPIGSAKAWRAWAISAGLTGSMLPIGATTSPKGKRIFWIDASSYVLRRMELPFEGDRRQFDPENQYANLAVWIDFKDPTFNAKIDEETFAKELAEGEQLVRRLIPAPPAAPSERR